MISLFLESRKTFFWRFWKFSFGRIYASLGRAFFAKHLPLALGNSNVRTRHRHLAFTEFYNIVDGLNGTAAIP